VSVAIRWRKSVVSSLPWGDTAGVNRPDALAAARAVVACRYPDATQAWLSGSVVLGKATPTSDLDITVLLKAGPAHRESIRHDGWPVELFVHTEASVRAFVAKDIGRRRPTMARLVASGVPLLDGPGGFDLQRECADAVAAGPGPLPPDELDLARYFLTDQLDDLVGGASVHVRDAIAIEVWRRTAELLLATAGWWEGGGKWLVREVEACDRDRGTVFAERLHVGLRAALAGDIGPLVSVAEEVLDLAGGRLWEGFALRARLPHDE
jgi:hypothetical protein